MTPVRTKESNFVYLGPTDEIADLPCRVEGTTTFSIWALTDEEREAIAAGGNIRLGIFGAVPIPPVSLGVVHDGDLMARRLWPCRICGKESTDPVHENGGAETHAFKGVRLNSIGGDI